MTIAESTSKPMAQGGNMVLNRIRVVLVDDHQLIRVGLKLALERDSDIRVVGEAASKTAALAELDRLRPDVLITDVRLPDGNGIDLTAEVRARNPEIGIVVLTVYGGDDQVIAALNAGASSFVGKEAPADDVIAAARQAAASPLTFTAGDLAGIMGRRMRGPVGPQLSRREREVLLLLVDGMSVNQISRRLYIADTTTKTHVSHIYEKMGASNRAQVVMAAIRLGIIDGRPGSGEN